MTLSLTELNKLIANAETVSFISSGRMSYISVHPSVFAHALQVIADLKAALRALDTYNDKDAMLVQNALSLVSRFENDVTGGGE